MTASAIDILMYHSISDGPGPTCIAPEAFRRQMAALAECDYRGVALAELAAWRRGEEQPAGKAVVLTFDDGFEDFADVVLPELQTRRWTATVFVPAGRVGTVADWTGATGRRLMSWKTLAELAGQGVEVGAHGVHHVDLTTLPPDVAGAEVTQSKQCIEERIGGTVPSFAAPYGRTSSAIRAEIGRHYQAAVGTTLARARPTSDLFNLPRIEMWYFRSPQRWQSYLQGRARGFLFLRQMMRRARAPGRLLAS